MKATVAHALMAMAVASMILAPQMEARAEHHGGGGARAEAKKNARAAAAFLKKKHVVVVDGAMGLVKKGGRLVYLTSFTPGIKYVLLVYGDNSLKNVALSVHGPKDSYGKFAFVGAAGHRKYDKASPARNDNFSVNKAGVYGLVMHHLDGTTAGAYGFFLIGIKRDKASYKRYSE